MLARLTSGLALASIAALVLVGCAPEESTETSSPPPTSPSPTPLSSDEELLTQARQSWDAYRSTMSELGGDPGSATLGRLQEVATPEMAVSLLQNFEDAADRRIHTEGERATTAFELADSSQAPGSMAFNVCVDLSQERYVGDEGVDLTPTDRPDERASTVEFASSDAGEEFLVAGEVEFAGARADDPCA